MLLCSPGLLTLLVFTFCVHFACVHFACVHVACVHLASAHQAVTTCTKSLLSHQCNNPKATQRNSKNSHKPTQPVTSQLSSLPGSFLHCQLRCKQRVKAWQCGKSRVSSYKSQGGTLQCIGCLCLTFLHFSNVAILAMWQKWVAPSSTSQGGNPGNRKGPAGKAAQLKKWNSMQGDGDLLENVNIKQWGGGWGIRCEGYYWLHHHHATHLGARPGSGTSWTEHHVCTFFNRWVTLFNKVCCAQNLSFFHEVLV